MDYSKHSSINDNIARTNLYIDIILFYHYKKVASIKLWLSSQQLMLKVAVTLGRRSHGVLKKSRTPTMLWQCCGITSERREIV